MGLATSTAISLAGLALATGSSAAGFAQLGKQNRLRKKAENAAEKALEEAKEKIDVNYARQLQVPLESYRRAMRESTAQQKQLLEAVQEGDQRGVAASVGKIGAAGTQNLANIRDLMGKQLYDRDVAIAREDARIAGKLADIGLAEVEGAQIAAAEAQKLGAQAGQGALQGLGEAGLQAASLAALYPTKKTTTTTPPGASVEEIMAQDAEFMTGVPGTLAHQKAFPESYLGVGRNILNIEEEEEVSDSKLTDSTSNLENILDEKTQTHTIKEGDTLYKLSQTYGISLDELKRLNPGIDATNIQIDDEIRLK